MVIRCKQYWSASDWAIIPVLQDTTIMMRNIYWNSISVMTTSIFAKGNRSKSSFFSAGWRISEEKFLVCVETVCSFSENQRFWGLVGNNRIALINIWTVSVKNGISFRRQAKRRRFNCFCKSRSECGKLPVWLISVLNWDY